MRLLDTHNFPPEQPRDDYTKRKYAILSHTWLSNEVVFDDLLRPPVPDTARHDESWAKIRGAQQIAAQNGFDYIWIDTVCIQKSSSAELGEAINSMFRWYKEADVCYVYLHDVEIALSSSGEIDVPAHFGRSRWFTRGWTLQELLGPRKLIFYDKDWKLIGNLASLSIEVAKITGIHEAAFSPDVDLTWFSIGQRMLWAAGRETTRLEDRAYSLLGILDVSLDIRYGEGERAFARLQEEIMQRSTDQSILAWGVPTHFESGDHRLYRGILAPSPDSFVACHNIVPYDAPKTSFTMTNKGLRMTAPVLDSIRVLLSCRFNNDPTIAIVLEVSPKLPSMESSRGEWMSSSFAAEREAQCEIKCLIHESIPDYSNAVLSEFIILRKDLRSQLDYGDPAPTSVVQGGNTFPNLWLIATNLAQARLPYTKCVSPYLRAIVPTSDIENLEFDHSMPMPTSEMRMFDCHTWHFPHCAKNGTLDVRLRNGVLQTVNLHIVARADFWGLRFATLEVVIAQETSSDGVGSATTALSKGSYSMPPIFCLHKLDRDNAVFIAFQRELIHGNATYTIRHSIVPRRFQTLWHLRNVLTPHLNVQVQRLMSWAVGITASTTGLLFQPSVRRYFAENPWRTLREVVMASPGSSIAVIFFYCTIIFIFGMGDCLRFVAELFNLDRLLGRLFIA